MQANSNQQQQIDLKKQRNQNLNNNQELNKQKNFKSIHENMQHFDLDNDQFDSTLQLQEDSPVGLTILPQNQTNQILQLDLFPNQKIYIRGKILYSNAKINHIQRRWDGQGDIIKFFKALYASSGFLMRKIHNGEDHIVYLGVVLEGGKILVIDNNVYGNDMYFKKNNLIMSTASHENGVIKCHPQLKGFQNWLRISQNQKRQRTIIALQSKKNCFTIEKYLAPEQHLYVAQSLILCISSKIKITKQVLEKPFAPIKLTGPGWVFIQNDSQSSSLKVNNKFGFLTTTIILILIGILVNILQG